MGDDKVDNVDDLASILGGMEPENPKAADQIKDALNEEQDKDS